jgi:hypothetical protein
MELHTIYKKSVFCSTVIKNKSKHETGTDDKPRTPTRHKKMVICFRSNKHEHMTPKV